MAAIVPKSMPAPFDREAVLAKLYALPVPPLVSTGGRRYPVTTPLGRIMRIKFLTVNEVAAMPECPNVRQLCDYLAGRKPISQRHRGGLARGLGVDPRIF